MEGCDLNVNGFSEFSIFFRAACCFAGKRRGSETKISPQERVTNKKRENLKSEKTIVFTPRYVLKTHGVWSVVCGI